jgi:excisionase family DNA binding protein
MTIIRKEQSVDKTIAEPIYCTIPEASRITGVKIRTFRSWVEQRKIPFHKVFGKVLLKTAEVIALIESNRIGPLDPVKQAKIMVGKALLFNDNSLDSGRTASRKGRGDV